MLIPSESTAENFVSAWNGLLGALEDAFRKLGERQFDYRIERIKGRSHNKDVFEILQREYEGWDRDEPFPSFVLLSKSVAIAEGLTAFGFNANYNMYYAIDTITRNVKLISMPDKIEFNCSSTITGFFNGMICMLELEILNERMGLKLTNEQRTEFANRAVIETGGETYVPFWRTIAGLQP